VDAYPVEYTVRVGHGFGIMSKCKNSSDMEDKIFDIVTDLIRDDISKDEAIGKLLILYSVSESFSKSDLLDLGNWFDGSPEFVEEVVNDWLNAR